MLLTEVEGKKLLKATGLPAPQSVLLESPNDLQQNAIKKLTYPLYAKAQVLHGNRELQGLIIKVNQADNLTKAIDRLFNSTDQYDQPVTTVLLEEAIESQIQQYLSLSYDTRLRQLVVQFSSKGGTGMDQRGESLETVPLSVVDKPQVFPPEPNLLPLIQQFWRLLKDHDATLVEVNPLVQSGDQYYCLDAKIKLEDAAKFRHEEWQQYPKRSALGRPPTEREQCAHEVSRMDHRGVAGESFFEFTGGEVAVMASGGGASLLAMDALMTAGVKPANYTEYSGNPTREKVAALAEVVLSIPKLKGLYVVGSNANFTDIYETLAGVVDGLVNSQYQDIPGFKVLIRRGGPRWQEAFTMVRQRLADTQFELKLFGPDFPVVETAQEMKQMLVASGKQKQ